MTAGIGLRFDRMRSISALAVGLVGVAPLAFLVMGSLRPAGEAPPLAPELIPARLTASNYPAVFDHVDLARQFLNSALVVAVAVPVSVLVGWWAGYAISRLGRRAALAAIGITLLAAMVPPTALLVGRFAVFDALRLTDTLVPLAAPALIATSPLHVLLFVWATRRLPAELLDVARLEGLSVFATWRHVVVPLTRRTAVVVAVLSFVTIWGNFLDPLVYLSDSDLYTLPLGLRSLAQLEKQDQPLMLAAAVMVTAPVVAAFLLVQRSIIQRPGAVVGLVSSDDPSEAR